MADNFNIKTDNEYLKDLYKKIVIPHQGDSGLDLYTPEDTVIPAKSKGELDL